MMREDGIGLYIHIPFCARVCHFCAFVTQGHREDRALLEARKGAE